MKVLLVTPPMTQINTPYPATAYLTGFLRKNGIDTVQADLSIELFLRLFSNTGLKEIAFELEKSRFKCQFFLERLSMYLETIDPVVRFLQGKDPTLAYRIVGREFLPEGPRFESLSEGADPNEPDPIAWAFGGLGISDRAKYLASLYIDDIADVIQNGIDSRFQISRYGEKLAASAASFDELDQALVGSPTLVDRYLDQLTSETLGRAMPDIVGITAPFPGNVYGAFRIAKWIKSNMPQVKTVLGGGYPNTELRKLSEVKVFRYFDFVTLDDGERPFLSLIEHCKGSLSINHLQRTYVLENEKVVLKSNPSFHDIPHKDIGTPTYDGLPVSNYLSIFEMLNPMHRVWSDGRWNKLTLAHGCYWRKCSFCDVSLDYIQRYDTAPADLIVNRIESLVKETGQSGFHFVDEAAPPVALRAISEKLIERGLAVTWWANVRFDKTFTPELAALMARAGCIAVSGGLEVASDRLLKLMQKGISVEQVAKVTHALTSAGIMVHAYLMYGFPSQTVQETVDALERVRQLFQEGCIQSAFWHRFSVTVHSPIGINPEKYGLKLLPRPEVTFAENDLPFMDSVECDHDFLGEGLKKALYNFMHGAGLDMDVRFWFGQKPGRKRETFVVPAPQVTKDLIHKALKKESTLKKSI